MGSGYGEKLLLRLAGSYKASGATEIDSSSRCLGKLPSRRGRFSYSRPYDRTIAADRSLASTFVGVQAMPLAVDNEDGTISLVENGCAIRLLTT